ncbi:MAG: hypothetical protein QG567_2186 [Campylobacterota bacterium]|nr:hypothetical protein [Campylobacterota bacterium]
MNWVLLFNKFAGVYCLNIITNVFKICLSSNYNYYNFGWIIFNFGLKMTL